MQSTKKTRRCLLLHVSESHACSRTTSYREYILDAAHTAASQSTSLACVPEIEDKISRTQIRVHVVEHCDMSYGRDERTSGCSSTVESAIQGETRSWAPRSSLLLDRDAGIVCDPSNSYIRPYGVWRSASYLWVRPVVAALARVE